MDEYAYPIISVPLRGTVNAGSSTVIISQKLDFPLITLRTYLAFELNTNRTVTAEFFLSEDDGTDSSAGSLGRSFFAGYSNQLTLVGDEEAIFFEHQIRSYAAASWLKLALINSDGFDHDVDSIVTAKILPRQTKPKPTE